MKKLTVLLICVLFGISSKAQIGSVKTEQYQAEFEKKQSLNVFIKQSLKKSKV